MASASDTPPVTQRSGMTERRPATDAEAKALASGLRLRILRMCIDAELTNREIAEALGMHPATVLPHVRTLVDTAYLEPLEPRRGRRGAREIPYRATGKSWFTQVPAGSSAMLDAFVTEVQQAPPQEVALSRFSVRLPPEELEEFRDRVQELLDDFASRPRDPEAQAWSVFFALHPDTSAGAVRHSQG